MPLGVDSQICYNKLQDSTTARWDSGRGRAIGDQISRQRGSMSTTGQQQGGGLRSRRGLVRDKDPGQGMGMEAACWLAPGVLRRLIELPSPPLSRHQLKRLEEHRYSSAGRSLLEPLMQRYWEWLVGQVPSWIAPNLITIIGLATNVFTTLVLVYYCPTATEQAPLWAYLLCAVGLFIYQSLDAIDGKQARRTNSSSPLGELFDHGCDSLSTVFVVLGTSIAVQLGTNPDWMFFCCFAGMFMFYCAHWQTYVSGTLRFGIFDITEVQICLAGIQMLTAAVGPCLWNMMVNLLAAAAWLSAVRLHNGCRPARSQAEKSDPQSATQKDAAKWRRSVLRKQLQVQQRVVEEDSGKMMMMMMRMMMMCCIDVTEVQIFIIIMYLLAAVGGSAFWQSLIPVLNIQMKMLPAICTFLGAIFSCTNYFRVIFTGGVGKNGSTIAGTSVLSPVLHIGSVIILAMMIYKKSAVQLFEKHPCLYILAFGFVSAKITNKLVVAHMTKSEMHLHDLAFLGPGLLFLDQYFNSFIDEYLVLWIALIISLFDLVRYCVSVCNQIACHLHIFVFKIKPCSVLSSAPH
ncbi:unnamed protein product [Menidia menidia]|uniref:Choline/ethanolaminephosphotransferase 1 n=1 Tax=Menidia menidia TaxID=238744 RepID=A0A8S4BJ64_9TELE|nr:unnamed protein product [Menidia menidia]